MKQQKLSGYKPDYPKKIIKSVVLTTAAAVAIGAAVGCSYIRPETTGIVPLEEPTPIEELQTEGMVSIDEQTTPEPDDLMLSGDVQIIDDMP